MKFGTIVLLLLMCISMHRVLGDSGECRRTIQMLHGRISWLDSANNILIRKIKEKRGCNHKSVNYRHGQTFEDLCHTCVCNNGLVACTDNTCNQECSHKSVNYSHGQTFEDLCNTCVCNNGLVACTDNLCNEECSHESVTYAHGETFDDDCNTCVCNNGLVACTNNTCNEGCRYSGVNHLHGDMFTSIDGCFSCTCQHGCVECETRICASPGHLGNFGGATRSAPTVNDVPGGFVWPGVPNPPWEAVDGNPSTHARAIPSIDPSDNTYAWWELEFQCTETISAVRLTSSDAGNHEIHFRNLVVTVDDALCGTIPTSPGPLVTVTVTCPEPLTGKSLRVLKNETANTVMRLAEVEPVLVPLPSGEVCHLVPLQ